MRAIAILVVVLGLDVVHTRRAEACGQAGPSDGSITVVGLYVLGTAAFALKDGVVSDHSAGYGFGEAMYNLPGALVWGLALNEELHDPYRSSDTIKAEAVFFGIHSLLLAHGIYTVARHRDRKDNTPAPRPYNGPPGMWQAAGVTAVVSPAPMANGAGIGLSGTF